MSEAECVQAEGWQREQLCSRIVRVCVCVRVCVRYGGCATAAMRQGEWRGNIPYREREGERGGEQGRVRQSK